MHGEKFNNQNKRRYESGGDSEMKTMSYITKQLQFIVKSVYFYNV